MREEAWVVLAGRLAPRHGQLGAKRLAKGGRLEPWLWSIMARMEAKAEGDEQGKTR